jgi:hypothetical protein
MHIDRLSNSFLWLQVYDIHLEIFAKGLGLDHDMTLMVLPLVYRSQT